MPQDIVNAEMSGRTYIYSRSFDPSITAVDAYAGTSCFGVAGAVKGKMWIKQDNGLSTNWKAVSTGAISYSGTWNATTNVPDLVAASPTKGDFWIVGTPGNTNLGGITDWGLNDWAVYRGAGIWDKIDNSELVTSVNTQTGDVSLEASNIPNDSAVPGATVKDALNNLSGGSSPLLTARWWDLIPRNGYVLPLSPAPFRAYYTCVEYNAVPTFFDGTSLRKYVAYFGGGTSGQAHVVFSDDGITWDTQTLVTGLTGVGYHASTIVVGGIIHYFYWDTTGSLYRPQAVRHATFNPAVSCVAAVSDAPLTGTYITGLIPDGLRYGTYGVDQAFYNAAPTNNPANPYSYQWCIIHSGVGTTTNEGILFATSTDGYNFSAWNALNEVVPRGISPAWDLCIGRINTFIDSKGLWHGFYSGGLGTGLGEDSNFAGGLGYVTSINGITWVKHKNNPVLLKTEMYKTWKRLYCPWVIKDGTNYKLYFTGKDNPGVYVTALADLQGFI